jgi:uncharacterized protein YecE (DUF72 family)
VDYLKTLIKEVPFEKALELRHPAWFKGNELRNMALELGFIPVSQDSPVLKEIINYPTIYMRFHGRNKEQWWAHEEAYERYNYLYSEEELRDMINELKKTNSERYLLYFNNHYQGKAFKNAQMLLGLWNTD